jgi:hypothetical protein
MRSILLLLGVVALAGCHSVFPHAPGAPMDLAPDDNSVREMQRLDVASKPESKVDAAPRPDVPGSDSGKLDTSPKPDAPRADLPPKPDVSPGEGVKGDKPVPVPDLWPAKEAPCVCAALAGAWDNCTGGSCKCGAQPPCAGGLNCIKGKCACIPSGLCTGCCNTDEGACVTSQSGMECGKLGAPCKSCDDKNPCTDDQCVAGACSYNYKLGASCDSDSNPCTLASCGATGTCNQWFAGSGTMCNDGSWCTTHDTCSGYGTNCVGTNRRDQLVGTSFFTDCMQDVAAQGIFDSCKAKCDDSQQKCVAGTQPNLVPCAKNGVVGRCVPVVGCCTGCIASTGCSAPPCCMDGGAKSRCGEGGVDCVDCGAGSGGCDPTLGICI